MTLEKRSPGRDSNRPGVIHRCQQFNGDKTCQPTPELQRAEVEDQGQVCRQAELELEAVERLLYVPHVFVMGAQIIQRDGFAKPVAHFPPNLQRTQQDFNRPGGISHQPVRNGDIVGLGTGSTAAYAVRFLGERVQAGLKIRGIPTSIHTRELAIRLGIPLTTLDEVQEIDLTIDGADEIDPELRLIKGGGGALLREKIVASASKRMVVIADSTKRVRILGKFPLPVEVIPLAESLLSKKIAALGSSVKLRQYAYGNPFVTDEGHHILDCQFGEILDPRALARQLDSIPGVVEHGLFVDMATVALIGKGDDVVEFRRNPR